MNGSFARCAYCDLPCPPPPRPDLPVYCCLGCRFAAAVAQERGTTGQIRWTLTRLGLAIFFTMNVMLFAMVLWSRDLFPPAPGEERELADAVTALFRSLCLLLSTPVLFLLGLPLAGNVLEQLRQRRVTTDLLLLTGVVASYAQSVYSMLRGDGHLYFEVACAVLVAVTLGRWLEAVGKQKTTQSLAELKSLLPDRICRWTEDGEEWIPPESLRRGERVRVRAGERLAVDGRIVRGRASLDRGLLTGESDPLSVGPGDTVLAGSVNLDGDLILEATSDGGRGTLASFVERVEQATAQKDRYQHLADRIAAWFLPATFAIALAVFAFHFSTRGTDAAIQAGLSVVLIACPCALGLATPLAIWSALGTAARHQILFRDGDALVRLREVRVMAFDKTGTLTEGHNIVTDCHVAETTDLERLGASLGPLTAASEHPHAKAIASWLAQRGLNATPAWHPVRTRPGRGLEADHLLGSDHVRLGRLDWLLEEGDTLAPELAEVAQRATAEGKAVTAVAWEGRVRAVFAMCEAARHEVASTLEQLRGLGLELVVLTGDDRRRAERTCGSWDVAIEAELSPEEKADRIEAWRKEWGPLAMVGEGLNDTPALATADVGIALEAAS
ncbi:MAG TPA: cation-translocating P-type ATPase, partial [Planctomycetaceae bacterium]|nr:cation-translocating P-type ATPase [Planctomycetaceae bacterium]